MQVGTRIIYTDSQVLVILGQLEGDVQAREVVAGEVFVTDLPFDSKNNVIINGVSDGVLDIEYVPIEKTYQDLIQENDTLRIELLMSEGVI